MPRKISPKYGIDPVQEVPLFSFTDAQIERLCAYAAVGRDRREMVAQLVRCARDYLWRLNQYRKKPTRAEQNAALKEVGQLARDLEIRLHSLDMDTEWELFAAFHTKSLDAVSDLADRIAEFADVAENVLQAGKRKSGPRIQHHVQRAVWQLANLYEEFTGELFSHTPRQRAEYDGLPHSRAGEFIVAFFQIVDPRIPSTSLSTAMAIIVRTRCAEDSGPSV
jgi:hypothetical protein